MRFECWITKATKHTHPEHVLLCFSTSTKVTRTGVCYIIRTLPVLFYFPYGIQVQIIQPTRCNSFTSLLLDVYVWLNMFRASHRPSSGAYNCTRSLWFYRWREVVGALLVVVWQTMTNNAPTTTLQR